jgi:hypothetical protein
LYLAQSKTGMAFGLLNVVVLRTDISIFLMTASHATKFDPFLLRDAQTHLEHAKTLDEDNAVAQIFLDRVRKTVLILGKN